MRVLTKSLIAATLTACFMTPALAADAPALERSKAPDNARIYIISPLDGDTVGQTFVVRFGLSGMGVAPSGIDASNTGHHHLYVDADKLPPADMPIPTDDHHIHFGGGQTQTVLHLEPGTHTLQIELANALHIPFKPRVVSSKITVHVE